MGRARSALTRELSRHARAAAVVVCTAFPCCAPPSGEDAGDEARQAADAATEASAPATAMRSVWSGVYTPEQAARGREAYLEACSSGCHLPDLSGSDVSPALRGDPFMQERAGSTVGDFYALVRSTMPENEPFSLAPEVYVDIVAYLLSANDLPSGSAELDASQPHLDLIAFGAGPAGPP